MPWRRLLVLVGVMGCGDNGGPALDADAGMDAAAIGCNPIVGDDCLTPFPSAYYLEGGKVAVPAANLPRAGAIPLSPAPLNGRDGFSPAMPFLLYLAGGVDPTQLPAQDDLAASILPSSPIQILDAETGARVPLFAELDVNARAGERQVLIIRPMVRLEPARRYVVALVGMRDAAGRPLAPAPFVALRDGHPMSPPMRPLGPRYAEIFAVLTAAGVPRSQVSLAWDVVTASDEPVIGRMEAMRDHAMALADAGELGWTVVGTMETPDDADRLREVRLTMEAPRFLASDAPDARLRLGPDGPVAEGKFHFPVTVVIPQCAKEATAPLPVVIFGHGLFGTAENTMRDRRLLRIAQRWCMVMVGTDWIGLATADLPAIAAALLVDFNKFLFVTDRLQQAHVNTLVLARLAGTRLGDEPALHQDGQRLLGSERYFFGISNGGIQGGTFMGLTTDVERGVLNVPGAAWNLMLFRSTALYAVLPILRGVMPDPMDQQVLAAVIQSEFDYTDPLTYAPRMLESKRILVQESIGDALVPNLATRLLARTMGLPGLDLLEPVFGITEEEGPLASAYTQWDIHAEPLPPTSNTPAEDDNGAHTGIQGLAPLQEQIRLFFQPDGQIQSTCDDGCDFP